METNAPLKPSEYKRNERGQFDRPGKTLLGSRALRNSLKNEKARRLFRIGEQFEAIDPQGRRWRVQEVWWLKGGQQTKLAWLFGKNKEIRLVRCQ
jgi:hypothetical protein